MNECMTERKKERDSRKTGDYKEVLNTLDTQN